MKNIVLFDGICNLCNQSIQFIIKRDPTERFYFASLQSDIGKQLIAEYHLPSSIDSLVLIQENHACVSSTAVLRIGSQLQGWKWVKVGLWIPPFLRDGLYQFISKNRYRWFGQQQSCMLPTPAIKNRFLENNKE